MKLTIEKVIQGGQGLARIPSENDPRRGMRVFVPFTLPGETVETEIVEEHRGYCMAQAHRIERASEFRVAPPCPCFGTCGGCQLQHATYAHQLEMKCEMLGESLRRAGIQELPAVESLSGGPFGYRNRVRLSLRTQPDFAIGYRQAKSHRLTAIDRCPIAAPLLNRCIAAIRELGSQNVLPENVCELELFMNHDESELLMTVWVAGPQKRDPNSYLEVFVKVREKIPQFSGAVVLPEENVRARPVTPLVQWGKKSLRYRAGGRQYTVSFGSFFQANATLLDQFVDAVVQGESGKLAWDLYGGVGLFSIALAERFESVVAVEQSAPAWQDLKGNLRGTKGHAVRSTTLDFLRKASQQIFKKRSAAPDLVLLDPPRAGAGVETCKLLAGCGPARIVYVSCDPATLGRDLAVLIQSGYRLERLQLVDMFPQTHHMESVAMLNR